MKFEVLSELGSFPVVFSLQGKLVIFVGEFLLFNVDMK
mgnify:FL=1